MCIFGHPYLHKTNYRCVCVIRFCLQRCVLVCACFQLFLQTCGVRLLQNYTSCCVWWWSHLECQVCMHVSSSVYSSIHVAFRVGIAFLTMCTCTDGHVAAVANTHSANKLSAKRPETFGHGPHAPRITINTCFMSWLTCTGFSKRRLSLVGHR